MRKEEEVKRIEGSRMDESDTTEESSECGMADCRGDMKESCNYINERLQKKEDGKQYTNSEEEEFDC